jgi:hypothetical protein
MVGLFLQCEYETLSLVLSSKPMIVVDAELGPVCPLS